VLAGRSLIRASELRSITTQYDRWVTATQSFRDRYFALPGDMRNAVTFWGAQAGSTEDGRDSSCYAVTVAASGTETCNGDGNNQIAGYVGSGSTNIKYETFRAWQHLANAGLIEGQYSGISSAVSQNNILLAGWNSPQTFIAKATWNISWMGTDPNITRLFAGNYSHALLFGEPW
jgi:hypothetical protein